MEKLTYLYIKRSLACRSSHHYVSHHLINVSLESASKEFCNCQELFLRLSLSLLNEPLRFDMVQVSSTPFWKELIKRVTIDTSVFSPLWGSLLMFLHIDLINPKGKWVNKYFEMWIKSSFNQRLLTGSCWYNLCFHVTGCCTVHTWWLDAG